MPPPTTSYLVLSTATNVLGHLQLHVRERVLVQHLHESLHRTIDDLVGRERQILRRHLLHSSHPGPLERLGASTSRSRRDVGVLLHRPWLLSRLRRIRVVVSDLAEVGRFHVTTVISRTTVVEAAIRRQSPKLVVPAAVAVARVAAVVAATRVFRAVAAATRGSL